MYVLMEHLVLEKRIDGRSFLHFLLDGIFLMKISLNLGVVQLIY